jgi:hypothetical protein
MLLGKYVFIALIYFMRFVLFLSTFIQVIIIDIS